MISESRLPEHFKAVKDSDENFLWIGEPKFFPFLCTGLPFLALGVLWFCIDYFGFIRHAGREQAGFLVPFFILHLTPFWLSILNMARLVLAHKNTFYTITNKRVMIRSGFWGIDFKAIDYDKITDIWVTVNPIEAMMKVGTVRFSAGRTNRQGKFVSDDFIAVENPYEVFKKVKSVSVDVKTDWNYPNQLRPGENPGYKTEYKPGQKDA